MVHRLYESKVVITWHQSHSFVSVIINAVQLVQSGIGSDYDLVPKYYSSFIANPFGIHAFSLPQKRSLQQGHVKQCTWRVHSHKICATQESNLHVVVLELDPATAIIYREVGITH